MESRFWVTRVLLHEGTRVQLHLLPSGTRESVEAEVNAGAFALLPDGSICEPVEDCGPDEPKAHAARAKLAEDFPDEDFRVLMVTPLPEGASS